MMAAALQQMCVDDAPALAIDASGTVASVAIAVRGTVHAGAIASPGRHDQTLLSLLDELVRSLGIERRTWAWVAFGRGPGSFTGIRIAAAMAQAIATATGCPLVGVDSLAARARAGWRGSGVVDQVVVVDARRDEVYAASYRINARGLPVANEARPVLVAPEHMTLAPARDAGGPWEATGDGWGPRIAGNEAAAARSGAAVALATDVLCIGRQLLTQGGGTDPADAMLDYPGGTRHWRLAVHPDAVHPDAG